MKAQNLKKSFVGSCIIIGLCYLAFLSCHKDNLTTQQAKNVAIGHGSVNFAMLKAAYSKGTAKNLKIVNDISQQTLANMIGSLAVDWASYTVQTFPDSTQFVEFQMPDDTSLFILGSANNGDTIKWNNRTKAVFILKSDTIQMSFFMKVIEDLPTPGSPSMIDSLHYLQIPSAFNGQVLYFTLDRQFINGYAWQQGTIINALTPTSASGPGTQTTQSMNPKINSLFYNCTTEAVTYLGVQVTDVGFPPWVPTVNFSYTPGYIEVCGYSGTIDPATPSGGGSVAGGVSGGGVASGSGNAGSTCPSTTEVSLKGKMTQSVQGCPVVTPPIVTIAPPTITDNLKNPCINGVLQSLLNKNLSNQITNILVNVFDQNDRVNLTFEENTSIPKNGPSQSYPTKNVTTSNGVRYFNEMIDLNPNVLSGASKEYIATIIVHEIIHAYLNENGTFYNNQLLQHETMAESFMDDLRIAVQQLFPSLSNEDAISMILGGFADISTLNATYWNDLLTHYKTSNSTIATVTGLYKNGSLGTTCN